MAVGTISGSGMLCSCYVLGEPVNQKGVTRESMAGEGDLWEEGGGTSLSLPK